MALIELDSVVLEIGGKSILQGISFTVEEGEVFALVGPSGCGKSTTLRLISGLADTTSGKVLVGGKKATSYEGRERRALTVWQGLALFPHLTVGENIEFGLRIRGVDRAARMQRSLEAANLVQLGGSLSRGLEGLSGGELQRVAIARALVVRPEILLMDEPFTGLDTRLKLSLQADLRELMAGFRCTYVIVTHSLQEVFALATRMGVMRSGRMIQVGRPNAIYASPADSFVAGFLGGRNLLQGRVRRGGREGIVIMVETPLGVYPGKATAAFEQGERVVYGVSVHDANVDDIGDCQGVVEFRAAEQEGRRESLYFRTLAGAELKVDRLNGGNGESTDRGVGEAVTVSWRSADAIVLRQAEAE